MTGRTRLGWGLIVFLVAFGGILAAEGVTLKGSFVWERKDDNRNGDVTAVFTPTGDNQWDVSFHFDWEDGPHIYSGTATGDLSGGDLKGAVEGDSEDRKMSFRFTGSFKDGTFTGTHAFLDKEGELRPTGTLTLRP